MSIKATYMPMAQQNSIFSKSLHTIGLCHATMLPYDTLVAKCHHIDFTLGKVGLLSLGVAYTYVDSHSENFVVILMIV